MWLASRTKTTTTFMKAPTARSSCKCLCEVLLVRISLLQPIYVPSALLFLTDTGVRWGRLVVGFHALLGFGRFLAPIARCHYLQMAAKVAKAFMRDELARPDIQVSSLCLPFSARRPWAIETAVRPGSFR